MSKLVVVKSETMGARVRVLVEIEKVGPKTTVSALVQLDELVESVRAALGAPSDDDDQVADAGGLRQAPRASTRSADDEDP